MTEKTWRGRPLFESPDGKFSTVDPDRFAAWQADQERRQQLDDRVTGRTFAPAESEQADASDDADENHPDDAGVPDGRGDGDRDGSGRVE